MYYLLLYDISCLRDIPTGLWMDWFNWRAAGNRTKEFVCFFQRICSKNNNNNKKNIYAKTRFFFRGIEMFSYIMTMAGPWPALAALFRHVPLIRWGSEAAQSSIHRNLIREGRWVDGIKNSRPPSGSHFPPSTLSFHLGIRAKVWRGMCGSHSNLPVNITSGW